jgi:hypothetical protein
MGRAAFFWLSHSAKDSLRFLFAAGNPVRVATALRAHFVDYL